MYGFRSVMGMNGMVTSPHYLATTAGVEILHRGGNAIEAAIVVASVIAVTYPHMNGIGGDNFWLIFDAKDGQVKSLQACGASGIHCTPEAYRKKGYKDAIPFRGALAANTVPGAVDGWHEAFNYSKNYLGGQFTFKELLEPAIRYAEEGYPVSRGQSVWTENSLSALAAVLGEGPILKNFTEMFLKPSGANYSPGERFMAPKLAKTLHSIAEGGREAFYFGPIADQIASYVQEHGGMLTSEDFSAHQSRWDDALSVRYRAWRVYNTPPPTQGLSSLQILSMLERYPIQEWGDNTVQYYHVMVEATKRAIQDRDAYLADPDRHKVPIDMLLSHEHIREMAESIDMTCAMNMKHRPIGGDTVWMGTVDRSGHAVSVIQSTYFEFGSGVVAGDTGVLLQNRGASFSLNQDAANVLEPRKRPFHTLNPAMALRDGVPELVYGTMGGEGQPQTQAAILTRILDLKMDVQAALDAPRWLYGRTWGEENVALNVESRLDDNIIHGLTRLGHHVQVVNPWDDKMGHAQAIWINPETKSMHGGADVRGDGIAGGI